MKDDEKPTSTDMADKFALIEAARVARAGNRGQPPKWWSQGHDATKYYKELRARRVERTVGRLANRYGWWRT